MEDPAHRRGHRKDAPRLSSCGSARPASSVTSRSLTPSRPWPSGAAGSAPATGVKSFELRRQVLGFDEVILKDRLEELVRGTNYRGHLKVTFPVKGDVTLIYNDSKINRWRATPWIIWMCYLTFMWLLTWPFLFFRTKRFEVAISEWPFSVEQEDGTRRYVSMPESHIFNLWGRAISRAVLAKRQGTLNQDDLIASQTAPAEPLAGLLEGAPRFLREGVNAITAVHRQLGWGGLHGLEQVLGRLDVADRRRCGRRRHPGRRAGS